MVVKKTKNNIMCKYIIEKRVALNKSYKRKKGLKKGIKTYNMY